MNKTIISLLSALFVSAVAATAQTAPSNLQLYRDSWPNVPWGQGNFTVVEGDWVYMWLSHSGSFPVTYEWKRDGQVLSDFTYSSFSKRVTPSDSGAYTVRVANSAGEATSTATTMTVLPLPKITANPAPGGLLGGSVTLSVTFPAGITTQNVQWFNDNGPVPGGNTASITVSNLRFSDAGKYRVSANYLNVNSNNRYVVSDAFNLKVYQSFTAPQIVTQPLPQAVEAGDTAVFSVGVAGTGPFAYQWRKNGSNLAGKTNSWLAVPNAQAGDAGNYSVVVTLPAGVAGGAVASQNAALSFTTYPTPNATANSHVLSARASLAQQSNAQLEAADQRLNDALTADANHPTARFFKASTRLANLVNRAAFGTFLDRLGVGANGRDLYSWSTPLAKDADGSLTAPAGVSAAEFLAFARTNALPEVIAARNDLAAIVDPAFTVALTPEEVGGTSPGASIFRDGGGAVTLDQGDLLLARSWLSFLEWWLRTADSWNLDVALTFLDSMKDMDQLNLQTVLQNHPQLFQYRDTSGLAAAQAALARSADEYTRGMAIVESRPAGLARLFNLDEDEREKEARFRANFLELKASLGALMTVDEAPAYRAQFSKLIDGTVSPRSLLPTFRANEPVGGTAPDATLNGAVQALGKPEIVALPTGTRAALGQTASIGVTAVGAEPLTYQWRKNGIPINGATSATLQF